MTTETFDLLAVLDSGIQYPETSTNIYLDIAGMDKLAYLETISVLGTEEESNAVQEEMSTLKEGILKSRLTLHLKGLPNSAVRAVVKSSKAKGEDDDDITADLLARTIYKVVNFDGAENIIRDRETVKKLLTLLPESEYGKVVEAYNNLGIDTLRAEGLLNDPSL